MYTPAYVFDNENEYYFKVKELANSFWHLLQANFCLL